MKKTKETSNPLLMEHSKIWLKSLTIEEYNKLSDKYYPKEIDSILEYKKSLGKIPTKQFKDGDIIVEIPLPNGRTFTNGKPFEYKSTMFDTDKFLLVLGFGYVHINNFELYVEKKSTREQALEWWDSLQNAEKIKPTYLYNKSQGLSLTRSHRNLTGREIEEIWLKETQNPFVDEIIEGNIHDDLPEYQKWWDKLDEDSKHYLIIKYNYANLYKIWKGETQKSEEFDWSDDSYLPKQYQDSTILGEADESLNSYIEHDEKYLDHPIKPNQKQFKDFNSDLFRAYIEKFKPSDRVHMKVILDRRIKEWELDKK